MAPVPFSQKHDIPLYSVPCLQYLRELEKDGKEKGAAEPASCPVTGKKPGCPVSVDGSKTTINGDIPAEQRSGMTNGETPHVNGDLAVEEAARDSCAPSSESPAEAGPVDDSAAQSPADSNAVEESVADSAAQSPAESSAVDESAAQSPADTDTAAATPSESAVPSPSESAQAPDGSAAPSTNGAPGRPAPVDGVSMVIKDPSVTAEEMNDYCARRFQFKTIRLMRFSTWRERRQYLRKKRAQRPQMCSKTKLLSFPVQPSRNSAAVPGTRLREWVLNPGGKSYVCILHEYLQHVLREQPVYNYSELKNAATPYGATVLVQSVQYGSGYGSSKKQAKSEAAKATLQIFIPNLMEQIETDKTVRGSTKPADMDLSFFDSVRVEDPRVADLCSKAAEPSPYTILLICLQRNFGLTGNQVTCKLHTNRHQHNEFEMTVGKHTARVPCKNKKDGKHLAAQSLLQVGSPVTWGGGAGAEHGVLPLKNRSRSALNLILLRGLLGRFLEYESILV